MTLEDLNSLNLPLINPNNETCLYVESALDWLERNTTLVFDKTDINSITSLPAGAKLFIVKFIDVMNVNTAVTSESIGGMSQSFSAANKNSLLMDLANDLIGGYVKSSFSFIPATRKWD